MDCTRNGRLNKTLCSPGANPRSFGQVLIQNQLRDIWRQQHPTDRDYTFFSRHRNSHSRINDILVPNSLTDKFIESDLGLRNWSAHAWVEGWFTSENIAKPQPSWRLDSNWLSAEPFRSDMEHELRTYFKLSNDWHLKQHHLGRDEGCFKRQADFYLLILSETEKRA